MNLSTDLRARASLDLQLASAATRVLGRRTPALSYAVATTTGLALSGAVGHADLQDRDQATPEHRFPWFSMTKIATATAVVRLAREGLLELDAPVGSYLPGYAAGAHPEPSLRQLVTHTAGLANPLPIRWVRPVGRPTDPELLPKILRKHGRPRRAPGGVAAYSNIGYLLAGEVIEAITGAPVEEVLTALVLRPLGMDNTSFTRDSAHPHATGYVRAPRAVQPLLRHLLPDDLLGDRVDGRTALRPFVVEGAAYGGLIGTAGDVARLAVAHLQPAGPLGDLTPMHRIEHRGKPFDHGIGWFRKPADVDREPSFVEHYGTGGGYWNAVRIYPSLGVAVVGMTNDTARWPFDEFFDSVRRALQQTRP